MSQFLAPVAMIEPRSIQGEQQEDEGLQDLKLREVGGHDVCDDVATTEDEARRISEWTTCTISSSRLSLRWASPSRTDPDVSSPSQARRSCPRASP
jgi:hypothetical protein